MKRKNLRLDDFLNFGKYKGWQVEDLIDDDPNYLSWLYDQDDEIFDIDVIDQLEKRKII
jgi:uncharacterized protein (DUF3820 family)